MNTNFQLYVGQIMNTWQEKIRECAQKMIDKYGYPDEVSACKLMWYKNGPWKRTIIHRDAYVYPFAKNSSCFLEQTIVYNHFIDEGEVYGFGGSNLYINIKGNELTAFGESETCNMVTLDKFHSLVSNHLAMND